MSIKISDEYGNKIATLTDEGELIDQSSKAEPDVEDAQHLPKKKKKKKKKKAE